MRTCATRLLFHTATSIAFTFTLNLTAIRNPPPPPQEARVTATPDPNDPALRAAVASILSDYIPQIRAKARADNADELERAGHDDAAYYLREVEDD